MADKHDKMGAVLRYKLRHMAAESLQELVDACLAIRRPNVSALRALMDKAGISARVNELWYAEAVYDEANRRAPDTIGDAEYDRIS
jgi:hypothetical protein